LWYRLLLFFSTLGDKIIHLSLIIYILSAVVVVQLFYYFFFFSKILFYREKEYKEGQKTQTISVIVCAHNELENLKKLIPAILSQDYESFELLVVDDRSTDGTFSYFSSLYQSDSKFKIIKIEKTPENFNSKKYALTKGIEAAIGEYLLLTDADCLPSSKNWIVEMGSRLNDKKDIVLGYSPYETKKGFLNLLIRYETLYTAMHYFSFALRGMPYMGVGRNVLYRKKLFLEKKGFENHRHITGGDDDLFINAVVTKENVAICFHKTAHVVSIPKMDFQSWFIQKRRHLSVGSNYQIKHLVVLGLQMLVQVSFYPLVAIAMFIHFELAIVFLMVRSLAFLLIFVLIARKLGEKYKEWYFLLGIELLYIFNYMLLMVSLSIYKKIKWN
jgi:glycosyltransferase involved in cell wall biosynthesis